MISGTVLVAAYLLMLAADPVLRSPEGALPPGAVARLGSVRMARPVRSYEQFVLTPDGTHAVILPGSSGFQRTSPEWWDLEKGRRVPPPFFPPMGSRFAGVTSAGIITADARGFQLRHPKTGAVLFAVPNAETMRRGGSSIPLFNHDGTIALIRNGNRLVLVRKQADGSPLQSELPITIENSWAVAHRGGAIVWSEGSEIKRYDVGTGETRLVTRLNEPLNVPAYLDIHPDGSAIVVVRRDRNYDLPPECQLFLGTNPVGKTLAPSKRTDSFGRIQFSHDGSKLYTVAGNEAAVWSFETGELLYEFLSKNWNRMIPSSDCRRLLAIDSYGRLQLIEWMTGQELTPAPPAISEFRSLHWLDNRTTVGAKLETTAVESQNQGVVVRWDATKGSGLKRFKFEDRAPWFVSTVSPDGRFVALNDNRNEFHRFRIQELETGRVLGEWTDSNPGEGFIGSFSPDGKTILARKNGQTGLFTFDGQRCLVTLTMGTTQRGRRPMSPVPANAQFSRDGRMIVSTQSEMGILAFEAATGQPRYIIPSYGSNNRFSNSFGRGGGSGFGNAVMSGDGRRMIVEAEGRSLLLDPATGTVHRLVDLQSRTRGAEIGATALSREGRWMAAVRSDNQDVVLYDLDASPGPEIVHTFRGMTGAVTALAFSPDDQLLVSVSMDGTAVTWDVERAIERYRERTAIISEVEWWNDLSADSLRAGRAMVTMIDRHPARAIALLGERLFVPEAIDPARVKAWITDLDAPEPATREFALASLRPIADQAAPALRTAFASTNSAEVRKRVNGLLELVDGPETDPLRLRTIRAIEVLERIGTPDARVVLTRLANGPAHAKVTMEAATALKRLTK